MNEEIQEMMTDLLTRRAAIGLDAEERVQLDKLLADTGVKDDDSLELAAAAIGLVDLEIDEKLPDHLAARIAASADNFFANVQYPETVSAPGITSEAAPDHDYQKMFTLEPRRSWNWLGWAMAGFACIALAVNVWFTRITPTEIGTNNPPAPATPEKLSPEQELAKMISSQVNMTKATWGAGNMKDLKEVGGDVYWSDEQQKGFMRLRGLPMNDKSKETYQLWIFDKTQDKATPIDGGTFDVDKNGEMIIPINAKLKALGPELFAITVEKPGGVVVSKRGKIAALAKVETKT